MQQHISPGMLQGGRGNTLEHPAITTSSNQREARSMTTFFGSLLATALVTQLQGGMIQGKLVDDQGKPVPDVQVIYFIPRPLDGTKELEEVATKTDAGGQFRLASPLHKRAAFRLWSYRPGSAIAMSSSYTPPLDLALRRPQ